jgi:hypothetical protein
MNVGDVLTVGDPVGLLEGRDDGSTEEEGNIDGVSVSHR